jgi:hypothetical protein
MLLNVEIVARRLAWRRFVPALPEIPMSVTIWGSTVEIAHGPIE